MTVVSYDSATAFKNQPELANVPWTGKPFRLEGTAATFFIWGAFDGASVLFQISPDGINWFTRTQYTWTNAGILQKGFTFYDPIAGGYGMWSIITPTANTLVSAAFCPSIR